MTQGVLFIGGRGPEPRQIRKILSGNEIICAADSGLDSALAAGIRPSAVVGDMDSLSDPALLKEFPAEAVERYPGDKDETDTELGLAWLRRQGCKELILVGGGEGRLDHSLALLGLFSGDEAPDRWYTAMEEIREIPESAEFTGRPGDSMSILPFGPGPWNVKSRGLHWSLDRVSWTAGFISLSNRFDGERVSLEVESGRFICIRPLEEAI